MAVLSVLSECITKHDDFSPMTNRSVLQQVRPLLRDKSGRGYRRRAGETEDQFLRAVSYRLCAGFVDTWVVRIQDLFQPVYHTFREKFNTEAATGYQSAQQRAYRIFLNKRLFNFSRHKCGTYSRAALI